MRTSGNGTRQRALAIVAVAAMLLAACGGDDSSTEASNNDDVTTTTFEEASTTTTELTTETTDTTIAEESPTTIAETGTTLPGATPTTSRPRTTTTKKGAATTSTTRRTGGTTATTASKKGTVKFGVLSTSIDERTRVVRDDETEAIAKAWRDDVNDAGGINGYKVELVFRDFKADSSRQLQAVKELDQAGVLAIPGESSFDITPSVSYIQKQRLPMISGFQPNDIWDVDPNFFQVASSFWASSYAGVATAKALGGTFYMSAYCTEVAACGLSVPKAREAAAREGLKYTSQSASALATDYTSLCLNAKEQGVDYISSAGLNFPNLVRDCQRQNYHPTYSNAGNNNQAAIDAARGDRLGGSFFEPPSLYPGPEMAHFRALAAKAGLTGAGRAEPNFLTVDAYLGFEMARAALELMDVPNPTRDDFRQALYRIKGETLGGLVPPTSYGAQASGGKYANDCWISSTVVDGKYVMVNRNGQVVNRLTWLCGTGHKYG